MRCTTLRLFLLIASFFVFGMLHFEQWIWGQQPSENGKLVQFKSGVTKITDDPLFAWERALTQFREVAALLEAGKGRQAYETLQRLSVELPTAYAEKAREALKTLPEGVRQDEKNRAELIGVNANKVDLSNVIFVDSILDGYYDYGKLGAVCKDLGAWKQAVFFYQQALKASPADHYAFCRDLCWMLMISEADEKEFLDLEKVIVHEGPKRECKDALETMRQRQAHQGDVAFFLEDYSCGTYGSWDELEVLKKLIPLIKTKQQKLEIYRNTISCLDGFGDAAGRDAWEAKILEDFKLDQDACGAVYAKKAERAYKDENRDLALSLYQKVCSEYPKSESFGISQFNVGTILQEQGKYSAAIEEYLKLFPSAVNDEDSTGNIMSPYRNYRNSAAKGIAKCYEAKKDFASALIWVDQARVKYSVRTFCGTCAASETTSTDKWMQELRDKIAKSSQ
jgi:tetratricopeptide (TPR) repeat protein